VQTYPQQYGAETGLVRPSDYVCALALAPGAEKTLPAPADARVALMSASGDFYARLNATAAVPVGDVTDGSGSELNPTMWRLAAGDVLHFITAGAACQLAVMFYG
jgi:hypothetical protein